VINATFKRRLYAYGLRARVPYPLLRGAGDALDAASRPADWRARRAAATSVRAESPWRGFVPRARGYRRVAPGEIPGLDDAVTEARAVFALRKEATLRDKTGLSAANPFYMVLQDRDVPRYPRLVEAALAPPLVEIATDYLGTVPRLQNVNIWLSTPLDRAYGSQLFHLDKPDVRLLSLFVNLGEVGPEQGPLTFLPADTSAVVRRATRYERRYYLGDGRLADDELFRHCRREDLVALTGAAGSGGFVDTSNCLHIGSRVEVGERAVLVVRYAPAHKMSGVVTKLLADRASCADPVRRLLLRDA